MESSDAEDVYDVERILAERVESGTTKYLVKWQGYLDDQCTWEPAENFDTSETLELWTKQKKIGDVLDNDDVQRIQHKMDAFQATQHGNESDSQYTSEGQSDIDFDQPVQPPEKRQKMVHDPPPLPSRSRNAKGLTRSQKGLRKTLNNTDLPPIQDVSHRKDNSLRKPRSKQMDAALLASQSDARRRRHTDTEVLRVEDTQGIGALKNRSQLTSKRPSTTFYAPELSQRKARSTTKPSSKRNAAGKPFKNLSHMNNARKLHADKYNIEQVPPICIPQSVEERDHDHNKRIVNDPDSESNDAYKLFFSDDENPDQQDFKNKQRCRRNTGDQIRMPDKNSLYNAPSRPPKNKVETEIGEESTHLQLSSDSTQHAVTSPTSTMRNDARKEPEVPTIIDKPNLPQRPLKESHNSRSSCLLPSPLSTNRAAVGNNVCASAISEVATGGDSPVHDAPSERSIDDNHPPATRNEENNSNLTPSDQFVSPSVAPNEHLDADLLEPPVSSKGRASRSVSTPVTQQSHEQPQDVEVVDHAQLARQYVPPGSIVRVATGREWIKGDLVVELYLTKRFVGGIKIQNLPWAQSAEVVRLKPKDEHRLPLYFDDVLSYTKYRSFTDTSPWWTSFSSGAVEPFFDSELNLASAADYLETNDLAAVGTNTLRSTSTNN